MLENSFTVTVKSQKYKATKKIGLYLYIPLRHIVNINFKDENNVTVIVHGAAGDYVMTKKLQYKTRYSRTITLSKDDIKILNAHSGDNYHITIKKLKKDIYHV
jgi:hypothetical protein